MIVEKKDGRTASCSHGLPWMDESSSSFLVTPIALVSGVALAAMMLMGFIEYFDKGVPFATSIPEQIVWFILGFVLSALWVAWLRVSWRSKGAATNDLENLGKLADELKAAGHEVPVLDGKVSELTNQDVSRWCKKASLLFTEIERRAVESERRSTIEELERKVEVKSRRDLLT